MFPGTGADASSPGTPRTPRGLGNTSFDTMTEEELSESLVYLTCPICEQVTSLAHHMRFAFFIFISMS